MNHKAIVAFHLACAPLILFLGVTPLWGSHKNPNLRYGFDQGTTVRDTLMILNGHGVPLNPLERDLRELEVVPAYLRMESLLPTPCGAKKCSMESLAGETGIGWEERRATGGGLVVSWFSGFRERWGYNLSLSFARMSGKTFAFADYDASDQLIQRFDADFKGTAVQGTALWIWDPVRKGRIRIPFFLGYALVFNDWSVNFRSPVQSFGGQVISYASSVRELVPGFVVGLSPQLDVARVRVAPFFTVVIPHFVGEVKAVYRNETTGQLLLSSRGRTHPIIVSAGIGIGYQPWGLMFAWTPRLLTTIRDGIEEEGRTDVFTLTKTFKWMGR